MQRVPRAAFFSFQFQGISRWIILRLMMKFRAWRAVIVCDYLHGGEMSSSKILMHTFGGFRKRLNAVSIYSGSPPTLQLRLCPRRFPVVLILTSQASTQMTDLKIGGEEAGCRAGALWSSSFMLFSLSLDCFQTVHLLTCIWKYPIQKGCAKAVGCSRCWTRTIWWNYFANGSRWEMLRSRVRTQTSQSRIMSYCKVKRSEKCYAVMQLFAISLLSWEMSPNVSLLNTE